MIMTLRLLPPVAADAGGRVDARSVVAAAAVTERAAGRERGRRGEPTPMVVEINEALAAADDDENFEATSARRVIDDVLVPFLLLEEAAGVALRPVDCFFFIGRGD